MWDRAPQVFLQEEKTVNIDVVVSPVAGAVIGYFTNYVAIKMLFKPYNEVKIGPVKMPFTPGLIPKEKPRLAKAMGEAVGRQILTNETIVNYLLKDEMTGYAQNAVLKLYDKAEKENIAFDDCGKVFFGSKWNEAKEKLSLYMYEEITKVLSSDEVREYISSAVYKKVQDFLGKKIKDIDKEGIFSVIEYTFNCVAADFMKSRKVKLMAEKAIWSVLTSLQNDPRKIKDVLSLSAVAEFKDYVSLKVPDAVNALMKLTENPEIEEFLKRKVRDVLNSIAGPFIGMFINEDDIYCKIITSLTEYFNNPENAPDIEHMVDVVTDSLTEKTVGEAMEIVMSQIRENSLGRFVEFTFGEISKFGNTADFIREFMAEHSDSSIMEIILKADGNFDKKLREYITGISDMFSEKLLSMLSKEKVDGILEKMLNVKITDVVEKLDIDRKTIADLSGNIYKNSVNTFAPEFIESFNVSAIVEEKINEFDMVFLEDMILSIAKKELSAITKLGGVLGFIIGLVPAVLSVI